MNLVTQNGINFGIPKQFSQDEVIWTWRAPKKEALRDPRLGGTNRQWVMRPNIILHQRKVKEDSSLEDISAQQYRELVNSIEDLSDLTPQDFQFTDGQIGILFDYVFSASSGSSFQIQQLQAIRLDTQQLTTLTYTIGASQLTEQKRKEILHCLASMSIQETLLKGAA